MARAGKVDAVMVRVAREEGKHAITRSRLTSTMTETLQAPTERCEKVEAELVIAFGQRSRAEEKTSDLTACLNARSKELGGSKAKLAAMAAALQGCKDAEIATVHQHLKVCGKERRKVESRLASMTAELVTEKDKTCSLAAELGMAREGLIAKNAVIERQSMKISEGVTLVVDQGHAALTLKWQLLESRTELGRTTYELELSKQAGKATKEKYRGSDPQGRDPPDLHG